MPAYSEIVSKGLSQARAARDAARACDAPLARRLARQARRTLKQARKVINATRIDTDGPFSAEDQVKDQQLALASISSAEDSLTFIDDFLLRCDDSFYMLAEFAFCLATEARDAALDCDPERARRLLAQARKTLKSAKDKLKKQIKGKDPKNRTLEENIAERNNSRTSTVLKDIEKRLAACEMKPPKALFPHVAGAGTFRGTKAGLSGIGGMNRISFEFRLLKPMECTDFCLVTVQHFEEPLTGKVVDPPSKARRKRDPNSFVDAISEFLSKPLRDGDAKKGYVVDANPTEDCPCLPGQKRAKLKPLGGGGRPVDGLTGRDSPTDLKEGFVAYFETVALCVDPKPPKILGSMRWRLTRKGNVYKTEILKNGRKTDWGPASPPFQRALKFWLGNGRKGCPETGLLK